MSVFRLLADAQVNCLGNGQCKTGLPSVAADNNALQIVMQLVFGILGAIAVIMIIVGSLLMTTAQGDPQQVARGRQTVMFAVVGLIVAISAEAIVTFVIGRL